ncbi:hypothetical protein HGRIS_009936 [Hohenbuehelia grisea]|uniref:CcmS related domain-containing protein n=1 Tax=Hohenbuehelia grisea TaxID=104357 RepID=A0ABR3J2S5_9AGAR
MAKKPKAKAKQAEQPAPPPPPPPAITTIIEEKEPEPENPKPSAPPPAAQIQQNEPVQEAHGWGMGGNDNFATGWGTEPMDNGGSGALGDLVDGTPSPGDGWALNDAVHEQLDGEHEHTDEDTLAHDHNHEHSHIKNHPSEPHVAWGAPPETEAVPIPPPQPAMAANPQPNTQAKPAAGNALSTASAAAAALASRYGAKASTGGNTPNVGAGWGQGEGGTWGSEAATGGGIWGQAPGQKPSAPKAPPNASSATAGNPAAGWMSWGYPSSGAPAPRPQPAPAAPSRTSGGHSTAWGMAAGHAAAPPVAASWGQAPAHGGGHPAAAAWGQVPGQSSSRASGAWGHPAQAVAGGWGGGAQGAWGTHPTAHPAAHPAQNAWGAAGGHGGGGGGWGAASEDDGYEYDDYGESVAESHDAWGRSTGAWGAQQQPAKSGGGWSTWGKEPQKAHKVTFADPERAGARPAVTAQQRSEILNSLLSQPSQGAYSYVAGAQSAQQQIKNKQAKHQEGAKGKKSKTMQEAQKGGAPAQDPWGAAGWGATGGDWGGNGDNGWGGGDGGGDWGKSGGGGGDWGGGGKSGGGKGEWGGAKSGGGGDWGTGGGRGGEDWGASNEDGWGAGGNDWGNTGGSDWGGGSDWNSKPNKRKQTSWGNGWDDIPEEDEEGYSDEDRRVHFTPASNSGHGDWGTTRVGSGYSMPSKTLAHAYKGTTTTLNTGPPHNDMYDYPNFTFQDSKAKALLPAQKALFGKTRFARDRIHWMFPPDKDERVSSLLAWVQAMSYNLGAYGLHKFLQSRERGALIVNAAYRPDKKPNEPAFDWLTFDQLQATMDRTLQTSAAFYDPAVQVIIFVFLPSKSGNSVAMWRRKISVPNNLRLQLQPEINLAKAGLRKEKDYAVHVDELNDLKKSAPVAKGKGPKAAKGAKPKKKVRWWNIFEW